MEDICSQAMRACDDARELLQGEPIPEDFTWVSQIEALLADRDAKNEIITALLEILRPTNVIKLTKEVWSEMSLAAVPDLHLYRKHLYARACEIAGRTE